MDDYSFIIWFGLQILGYLWGIFCLRKWHFPMWFYNCTKSWLIYNSNGTFQIGQSSQDPVDRATHLTRQVIFSLGPYYTFFRHIDYADPYSLFYLIPYFLIIPLFGCLGKVRGLQTSLSCGSFRKWPIQSWIAYILAGLLYVGCIVWNLYWHFTIPIVVAMGLSILFIGALVYYVYGEDKITPHYHHWVVGYTGSLINYGQDPLSRVLAMLFYGVFVEEAVDYGILDVFRDDEDIY